MKRFTIDCQGVASFADFVAAANAGLVHGVGGDWNGSLDAFNDYLTWPQDDTYELELTDASSCAAALGHTAQAAWLREKLATCHSSNVSTMRTQLASAERGEGQTLFDVILEIICANEQVQLIER